MCSLLYGWSSSITENKEYIFNVGCHYPRSFEKQVPVYRMSQLLIKNNFMKDSVDEAGWPFELVGGFDGTNEPDHTHTCVVWQILITSASIYTMH